MAQPERTFSTELTDEEYDSISTDSPFITIPAKAGKEPAEGDDIYLIVEAGAADWKEPGKSLNVVLTVIEDGENKGKTINWWPGVSKDAMRITKRALIAFGIEDKVLRRVDGKIKIAPMGFAGARARAHFIRQRSTQGKFMMRTILDSTAFLPIESDKTDIGIGKDKDLPF